VLGEYRRFLFLAMEAGHPVSPSRAVDLAWHQHLLDTRSYWQLLAGVLPQGAGPAVAPHPIAGGRGGAAAAGGVLPPHAGKLPGLLRRGPACGPLACGCAACG
jgi:hypothetical protein